MRIYFGHDCVRLLIVGLVWEMVKEILLSKMTESCSCFCHFSETGCCNIWFAANRCSLEIDYKQFIFVHPNIAIWLADAPQPVLEVMEDVAKRVVFDIHPNYKNIHQKIYVRINNLPVYDQIRNIRYPGRFMVQGLFNYMFCFLISLSILFSIVSCCIL